MSLLQNAYKTFLWYFVIFFSGSSQLTAVVAFTLAMFSQLVQQVIHHVQDSVFNMSFTSFASPPTTTYSLELNSTQSAGESNSNVPLPTHALNNGEPSGQSCATQDTVAIVNGCSSAGKNNSQEAKAVTKKKKSKHLQRLRGRRRRRRRRQNSSEDSDLSDGNFYLLFSLYVLESISWTMITTLNTED